MGKLISIEEIFINETSFFCIKPKAYDFSMIYRSAMGVHWNSKMKYLYYGETTKNDIDILKAYKRILLAVDNEYGIKLIIRNNTIIKNISDDVKIEIEKSN